MMYDKEFKKWPNIPSMGSQENILLSTDKADLSIAPEIESLKDFKLCRHWRFHICSLMYECVNRQRRNPSRHAEKLRRTGVFALTMKLLEGKNNLFLYYGFSTKP